MKPPKIEILPTNDGSVTLYLPSLDETYHSRHGAVCESMYVYLLRGVVDWYLGKREVDGLGISGLRVFEMGFGTGLNAWLLKEFAESMGLKVRYFGIEKFPLSEELSDSVDFGFDDIGKYWRRINGSILDGLFDDGKMCREHWQGLFEQGFMILEGGKVDFDLGEENIWNGVVGYGSSGFYKVEGDVLRDLEQVMPMGIDVVFWDAFAPKKQPELWSVDLFERVFQRMAIGGVLVTYTANSQVRRNLASAGFRVERVAGPPGKRHMLRAWK
ncbi:MAG: tRNA (5-methylaminomethyl-2-thiouridine)(34)-methyltransferase MnmD [Bacteroidota bacterium]|jgi:tRNA U34 5-methylaminomethyl-2-thiouridine-forming methyltransferase MnmC